MKRAWKPLVMLTMLAGLGSLLTWAFIEGRAEFAMEQERERPVKAPLRVATVGGESIVTLSAEELARAGIGVAPVKTITHSNTRYVPGTVIDTEELLTLQRHFEATRDRLRELPRAGSGALEVLKDGVQRRWGAVIARWLIEQAPPWRRLRHGQDVLVRVAFAPGVSPPLHAWLPTGVGQRVALTFVSPLPQETHEENTPVLYLAPADALGTRATNSVTVAFAEGAAEPGTSLPASAVVWWEGRSWIYVPQRPGRFARRAVTVRPASGNELIVTGLAADTPVVVSGAQLLLSEEQRAQIQVGEDDK